jgi:serine/threonine-protein kinase RsbW
MPVPVEATEDRRVFGWAMTVRVEEIEQWRREVSSVLALWAVPEHVITVARLGVTELLSNVAKHAGDPRCYLGMERIADRAVIRVFDRSPRLPVIKEPRWDQESGRGLWLLREMADQFGYEAAHPRQGKVIWFSCDLRSTEGVAGPCVD